MNLIDTDVLIDVQRGLSAAVGWLALNRSTEIHVPGVVCLELLSGSRSKAELQANMKFLEGFSVLWHTEADNRAARQLIERYTLTCALSIPDYLIAAQALNHGTILFTFNLKHFRAIPSLDAHAPYIR